jgi:hypothetical protein
LKETRGNRGEWLRSIRPKRATLLAVLIEDLGKFTQQTGAIAPTGAPVLAGQNRRPNWVKRSRILAVLVE